MIDLPPPAHSPRTRNAWIAFAVAVALYVLFQAAPLLVGPEPAGHQNDFKHLYLGAFLLARGENPYDAAKLMEYREIFATEDARFQRGIMPYVYLPFTGLVMSPLTLLSFGSAAVAWQLLNHVLLIAGLWLAARAAGWEWSAKSVALLASAVVLNMSVTRQNTAGQLNMALFFGSALLVFGLVRGWHPAAVGFIAAFLAMFKITPGIFLIYFLVTRRWKLAAWMAGWCAILMAASIALVGWNVHRDFLPLLSEMGFGKSTWWQLGQTFWRDPYNQSPNALFHRALVPGNFYAPWTAPGPEGRPALPPWESYTGAAASRAAWANGLTVAVALCILAAAAWAWTKTAEKGGGRTAESERAGFSIAVLAGLLIPSLMWDHYLVQALLPAILLWPRGECGACATRARVIIGAALLVSCLGMEFEAGLLHWSIWGQPLVALTGGSPPAAAGFLFGSIRLPYGGLIGVIFQSLKLWPVLALYGLAMGRSWLASRRTFGPISGSSNP